MQKRSILRLLEYPGIYIRVHSLLVAVAVPVCATANFRSVFFSINFTRKAKNEEPSRVITIIEREKITGSWLLRGCKKTF